MATKTITIRQSVYEKIADYKEDGESFSDMLDREFDRRIRTGRDMLDWLDKERAAGRRPLAQRANAPRRRK